MFGPIKKLFAPKPGAGETLHVNAYSTLARVAPPPFARGLQRRDDADPALREHLDGFLHYLQSLGGGRMSTSRYHAMRHVQRTRHQLSFEVAGTDRAALAAWANGANALLLLPDGQLRDPQLRVLVASSDGGAEPDAALPYPPDARRRKAASEALLAARGLASAASLPPVAGEAELRLRDAAEVGRRAVALLAVALRAESLASGHPLPSAELESKLPGLRQALSPQEAAFLDQERPDQSTLAQFSWRYEALATLEWALGLAELPWPGQPCDAGQVAQALLDGLGNATPERLALRPAAAILDALDQHLRLHWQVRQARLRGTPPPPGVEAGVVAERHHALNWLCRFENRDWDDTDTPT